MAEESELVGGISVSLGATHERLAGDIAAANAIVEEQWSNKVFTAKLRVESASGAGQIGPAAAPGAAQAGPIVVQARAIEETGAQTAQARSALAIPTQQTTPGMTEGERVVEGLGGVEDATSGVAKSVQELAELQGRGTEAPTPAIVAQQRVERVQAAVGETQTAAGSDVELARTNALLASHLESLSAGIIGLGDRLGGAPVRGGGRAAPGPAVSFGPGGSIRGGQLENLPTALQAQIRSALGEAEQGTAKTTVEAVATARPQQTQATEQIGSNLAAIVNEIVGRLSALSAGLGAFTERLALAGAGPVGATPRSQAVAVEQAAALRSAPVPAAREAIASVEVQAQTVSVEPLTTPAAQAATPSIGVPVTASSMQMRDAEQAAAVRARRETQNEARVAATAVQDRGIPDTSQEWLEERYTRPLAAQAAVGTVPVVAPRVQTGAVERAAVAREPQRVVRQAVDTVEIAAQNVAMPAAQVEAQAASIEAPRAAVTAERPEPVATTSVQPTQLSLFEGQPGPRPASQTGLGAQLQMFPEPRPTTESGRGARLAAAAEADENENRLANSVRFAGRAKAEEERADARIQSARVRAAKQAYSESESQRREELASTGSFYDKIALIAEKHFTGEEVRAARAEPLLQRADDQERLRNLSYEAARDASEIPTSRTFAPQATPAQIAARREEAARPVDAAPAPPPTLAQRRQLTQQQAARDERQRQAGIAAGVTPAIDTGARAEEARIANVEALKASARVRVQAFDEAAQERVVQSRRAAVTASGRTGRTAAFGIGTLFGGTQGRQIEAQAEASQAARQLRSAERAIQPLDDRLRDVAKAWQSSTGEARKFQREQFLGIRTSSQYREALAGVKSALDADAAAQAKLTSLQGFRSITQNLLAGAAGGAAFGVALGAMSAGFRVAQKTLGAFVDEQTGFGSTSTRVTTALAAQTTALQGNIDAALSAAEAQAGLNQGAIEYLGTQLRLTTQIKAGATAQQNASELFRAAAGAQNAPQGLFGGFGGVAGTGLLAEQMGGGKGFSEIVQGDLSNLSRPQDQGDVFAQIGQGLSYLANPDFRQTIDNLSAQQGKPTPSQANPIGNALGGLLPIGGASALLGGLGDQFFRGGQAPPTQQEVEAERAAQAQDINGPIRNYLDNLNANIERGGGQGKFEFTVDPEMRRLGMASAAAAGDLYGVTAASQGFVVTLNGAVASTKDYTAAMSAAAVAASRPTPEALLGQFTQINPAIVNAANRQQQYAIQTQLPAQQALGNLANPLQPIGTGYAAGASAAEMEKIKDTQAESQRLQDGLNARYSQGEQILRDTYHVTTDQIEQLRASGAAIASLQAGISNAQMAYQVHQYNYQLFIAKRTLSDISGLTGKNFGGVGQSYLGQLEKENLALSRQAQLLQFTLAHRRINFQIAQAGFQAPGETPEQIAANVEEAKYEASVAEKLLGYQEEMFGNTVQIVDINNLRQGEDLVKQIFGPGGLIAGRALVLKVQADTEQINLEVTKRQQQLEEISTQISKMDSHFATANSQIQQLEVAAGKAVAGVAARVLEQFNLFLAGVNSSLENMFGTPQQPGLETGDRPPVRDEQRTSRLPSAGSVSPPVERTPHQIEREYASGTLGRATGRTDITVGEAGTEEVAVLRNPRAYLGGGDGEVNVTINFSGVSVRSENDIDTIVRKVTDAMNSRAGLLLRTG